ncbi:MAG: type II secretion system F family protein [Candidatus Hydrogenedentes bacterium]|nr:type II secretion system F family protein [Candidatus Hydrogenedentota bacterium]
MPTKADKPAGRIKRVSPATKKRAAARKAAPKATDVVVDEEEAVVVADDDAPSMVITPKPKTSGFLSFGGIRRDEITAFLRQLIMMLEAGTPLLKALKTLGERAERPGLRAMLTDVSDHVESGNALWQSFERHPRHFDTVFINLVKASEASGTLVTVLRRQVEYWERSEMLGKRVKRAMYYPVVLVCVCALVVLLLAKVVIPQFEQVFEQIGTELEWYTIWFIWIIKFVTSIPFVLLVVAALVALGVLYRWWCTSPMNRLRRDKIKLRIPKIGPGIIRKYAVVQFTRSLSLLLRSGLSMMVTLDLARTAIHNQAVAQVLQSVRDSVERGEGIEQPLRQAEGVIPPVVTDMLVTGEESGQLDTIAEHIADTYEEEVNIALAGLGDMIQPVLTVIVGGVVLVAALALFVPMIGMVQQVSNL